MAVKLRGRLLDLFAYEGGPWFKAVRAVTLGAVLVGLVVDVMYLFVLPLFTSGQGD